MGKKDKKEKAATVETTTTTEQATIKARKTVTVTFIDYEAFGHSEELAVEANVTKFSDGVILAEFSGERASAKSESAAINHVLTNLLGEKPKAAQTAVETTDWQVVKNTPDYTADKDNAAELKSLSKVVEKAGKDLAAGVTKTRAATISIGASLNKAWSLLALDTAKDSGNGASSTRAWGEWLVATPYAYALKQKRAANISEYRIAAKLPDALLEVASDDLISAKALSGFYTKGFNTVAKRIADKNRKKLKPVYADGKASLDMSAGVFDLVEDALEKLVEHGEAREAHGTVYNPQTDEQKNDNEPATIDSGNERVRLEDVETGRFASHIFDGLEGLSDAQFLVSKFGKALVKAVDACANEKTEAQQAEEKVSDAAEVLGAAFNELSLDQAIEHIVAITQGHAQEKAIFEGCLDYIKG